MTHPDDTEEFVGDEKYDNNNRINNEIEVTRLDVTTPDSMARGAAEEKDEDDEINYDEKEAECPVLTPPVYMEECVGKKIDDKNDIIDENTSEGENTDYVIPTVNDAEGTDLTFYFDKE